MKYYVPYKIFSKSIDNKGLNLESEERNNKAEIDKMLKDDEKLKERIEDLNFFGNLQLRTKDVIAPERLTYFRLKISPYEEEELDYVLLKQ